MRIRLPTSPTSFVGRERELAHVRQSLQTARLLTITGPGGSGKTRLALQAAAQLAPEFDDNAYWCGLAALSDSAYVPQAVARVMDIEEQPGRSATEAIVEFIQSCPVLLILDNCEHLFEACAALASAILDACPHAKILATSLQPLGLAQEHVWQAPPLALPAAAAEPEAQTQCDSVRLFIERATEALPTFVYDDQNAQTIAAICRRLDGLPLAIELAAARVKLLSLQQIAERLENAFALLKRGKTDALPRHQTLRATMDWTYTFLSEPEQTLLRRLSVFVGSFALELVEQVCGDAKTENDRNNPPMLDLLAGLVDKSFVVLLPRDGTNPAHYRLLEMIRQYAREKLEDSGESHTIGNRYLDWCVRWAEQAEAYLAQPDQGAWLKQFEAQEEHFRASLRWACTSHQTEMGLRLANALLRFWLTGEMAEGRVWLDELLNLEASHRPSGDFPVANRTRAQALFASGRLAVRVGDDELATRRGEASLALFRALGDSRGILNALNTLALAAQDQNDCARASALYDEALALSRQTNDPRMAAVVLGNQGLMYYEQQDYRRVAPLWEEANAIAERGHAAAPLDNLGCLAMMQGDFARAHHLLQKEWQTVSEADDKHGIALVRMDLGEVARRQGDLDRAGTLLQDALERHCQMNNPTRIGEALVYLAHIARHRGKILDAKNLYEQSLSSLVKSNYTRYLCHAKTGLGILQVMQGRDQTALPLFRESLRIAEKGNHRLCRVEALEEMAGIWARRGDVQRAARYLAITQTERQTLGTPVPPVERERYDQTMAAVCAALRYGEWETIQADARTLMLQQIMTEAMGEETSAIAPVVAPEPASKIYALGTTRVIVGERAIRPSEWKYTKAKELFFYLLTNRRATKSQIGLALWPDASSEQLRNIFHRAMHYMRKALGHPEWIVFEEDTYALDRHATFWYDLYEFEAGLKEAQSLCRGGLPQSGARARAIQCLEAAVTLWRGDFLEEQDAGEWAILKRESLRQAFLQALLDLGSLYLAEARYADAVAVYDRALSLDDYLEVAHRELMRAYARQGDVGRAVQHFDQLRRMMRAEFSAEPSAETLLLYERLRRGDAV